MNNLLLLGALAAGYVYFTKPKTTTKKSSPKTETIPKDAILSAGSKEIGYEIYDCDKLVIYDAKKSYKYAFDLGTTVKEDLGQFDDLLFGQCFENAKDIVRLKKIINTSEKAVFVFNLFKNIISGYFLNHGEKDEMIEKLQEIKNVLITTLGFDTSKFEIGLIINDNPIPLEKGFTITNCEKFTVTDSVKMKKYMDDLLVSTFNSTNYKDDDFNAPFDFAVEMLKLISPECYSKLVSNNFTKDNFIISYMFIMTAFFAYISFKYLMKDGVIDQLNWQESFASKEEWDAFMINVMKVLSDWVSPLFIKFDLSDVKMQEYVIQIQNAGKYPLK